MKIAEFLLGVVAAASATAGIFFLKFWRETRDTFFLAFAAYFFLEAVTRTVLLSFEHPNEGSPWIYVVRLVALIWILTAILRKNSGAGRNF